MSTDPIIDHCKVPDEVTYKTLSWLMIGEFMLGLPLNLSVLYVFVFRYEETQSLYHCLFPIFRKYFKSKMQITVVSKKSGNSFQVALYQVIQCRKLELDN